MDTNDITDGKSLNTEQPEEPKISIEQNLKNFLFMEMQNGNVITWEYINKLCQDSPSKWVAVFECFCDFTGREESTVLTIASAWIGYLASKIRLEEDSAGLKIKEDEGIRLVIEHIIKYRSLKDKKSLIGLYKSELESHNFNTEEKLALSSIWVQTLINEVENRDEKDSKIKNGLLNKKRFE